MPLYPDVASLLRAHRIDAPEAALAHNGFSGARITSITQGADRYVLKRNRLADDWIMRVTADANGREAQFAASPIFARLPRPVAVPSLGAARDGNGWAILMRDISALLWRDDAVMPDQDLDVVLSRLAAMHAAFWEDPMNDADVSWCGARERLSMLSPEIGRMLVREERDFGIERGWAAFGALALPDAARLIRALQADLSPLLAAIGALPPTLVHGDVKFANIGLDAAKLHLFDWAMVMRAPVALEVAWLAAVNARLVQGPFEVFDRYAAHLEGVLGANVFGAANWPRQRAVAGIGAVLLLGWAKALDAEDGRPEELRWWCERALEGASLLGMT